MHHAITCAVAPGAFRHPLRVAAAREPHLVGVEEDRHANAGWLWAKLSVAPCRTYILLAKRAQTAQFEGVVPHRRDRERVGRVVATAAGI